MSRIVSRYTNWDKSIALAIATLPFKVRFLLFLFSLGDLTLMILTSKKLYNFRSFESEVIPNNVNSVTLYKFDHKQMFYTTGLEFSPSMFSSPSTLHSRIQSTSPTWPWTTRWTTSLRWTTQGLTISELWILFKNWILENLLISKSTNVFDTDDS